MKLLLIGYVERSDYLASDLNPLPAVSVDGMHPIKVREYFDRLLLERPGDELVVLTSSNETIFNIAGHGIAEGALSPEDVSVVLFDGRQRIECGYDAEGFLAKGYPFGFFDWSRETPG